MPTSILCNFLIKAKKINMFLFFTIMDTSEEDISLHHQGMATFPSVPKNGCATFGCCEKNEFLWKAPVGLR